MAHCKLCDDDIPDADLLEHVRVLHPDIHKEGYDRWPDGDIVVTDDTLDPDEFR